MSSGIYPGPLETFRGHFHVPQHSQIVPRDNSWVARDRSHDPQDLPPPRDPPSPSRSFQGCLNQPKPSTHNPTSFHGLPFQLIILVIIIILLIHLFIPFIILLPLLILNFILSFYSFIYLFIYISTHIFHSKWIRFSFSAPKRPMSVYSPF